MNHLDETRPFQPEACDTPVRHSAPAADPERIGRYRVEKVLGAGGFGRVYLAHDEQLDRPVAIKVPHRELVARPEDAQAYLGEARMVAGLDHPHIVSVFDFGSTEDHPCFIVSKFIEGTTLAKKIKDERPSVNEAAELVATAAEALDYAHRKGLVHRDVKPGNILLDKSGKPHLADFGLALKEENVGKGPTNVGTPAYMSPEQARGEGHRVDGRSDIFSLGVVLYELLTGRQPFRGGSKFELLEQITSFDPRPLRQIDPRIPKELERICFKALSKRASERYMTAQDLADDIRQFLAEQTLILASGLAAAGSGPPSATAAVVPISFVAQSRDHAAGRTPSGTSGSTLSTSISEDQSIKVVPKGLRSFDAHDADFFLELLPGPWDREGLPDSIRFWKTRIEECDPDNTFSIGLIYGSSGCGKSSLVKAGLLPRLTGEVIAVYLEASANETETRLLNGLRKRCTALPAKLGLKETLAALRLGQGIPAGKKALIVLDQFEQWLHAKREEQNTELVQALRQCDGGHLKCIVMVRDDFWMAATRFMRDLEIDLLPGHNIAAVDLFSPRHARKVLIAFGRAFGALPEFPLEPSREQKAFIEQAVWGLTQEGRIVCVRLALFAEMMKGRPWTLASLKEVGGTEGVGVTFLEETFSSPTANPKHRLHQKAARIVLQALLPETGTDIKGHMRSYAELLEASGYASHPREFEELIRILDSEVRLITPTDPEGGEATVVAWPGGLATTEAEAHSGQKYYQLTHDYLVHSLRDWLTRKQKETRRGRAELLLADRASVWIARPENRQLPSFPQWVNICLLTQKQHWTESHRKMMRKATHYHALRSLLLAVMLLAAGLVGLSIHGQVKEQGRANHAAALVKHLQDANIAEVPRIIKEIEPFRAWADPLLREANAAAADHSRQKLHTSLALLPVDATQVAYLYKRLLDAAPQEVAILCEALRDHEQELVDNLWTAVEQPAKGLEHRRLRAACALTMYDPDSQRWAKVQDQIAIDLVGEPAVYLAAWMESLHPVRSQLLTPLAVVFRDSKRRETERSLATDILCDYAADQPEVLADLLMDADEKQFLKLFPKLREQGKSGLLLLDAELEKHLLPDAKKDAKERLAKRQANAAAALLKMDRSTKVWPLLKHSPEPRARSYLIHDLGPAGVDPAVIVKQLEGEPDLTIRRALVLSLGEFGEKEFAHDQRDVLLDMLHKWYRNAPDPGLHGAVEWLLRQWKQDQWLGQTEQEWAKDRQQRDERLGYIKEKLAKRKADRQPQWYVNGQGQTLVVLPGPVEFLMGSPPAEVGRSPHENLHPQRIDRTFAVAAKLVTVEQFLRFRRDYDYLLQYAPTGDCPAHRVTWYMAAAYCNWLSRQEGLPEKEWCYQPREEGKYEEGMKLAPNYLQRAGYRLPTEAEWEYACRAGALTSWYYGESEELLGKYAWYVMNSGNRSWPVASLKPNDWGLFDMHGNLLTWCQESYKESVAGAAGEAVDDIEDSLTVFDKDRRGLRGGTFADPSQDVRAANRVPTTPLQSITYVGFRVARTFR